MSKQLSNQYNIYKIKSERIIKAKKMDLKITMEEAIKNKEIVSLAESEVFRFINEIRGIKDRDTLINDKKQKIKELTREDKDNRKQIKKLMKEINDLKFTDDYITIVFKDKKQFKKIRNSEFKINGNKYKRLVGTTGGVKKKTIVFVKEDIHEELKRRMLNGAKPKKIVPAKLEAYLALSCSASNRVENTERVIVVDDLTNKLKEDVIYICENEDKIPRPEFRKDYEFELIDSDGCGLIRPSLARKWGANLQLHLDEEEVPTGFCIRNAYCKGMVYSFDFEAFGEEIAKTYMVKDIWGIYRDVREADLILTGSMLKLWDAYDSIEDYFKNCRANGYKFSVTKALPLELEDNRTTNYQFVQSFEMTEEELKDFIRPTIDNIKLSMGKTYEETLLYLQGKNMTENSIKGLQDDFTKAVAINKVMLKDPYVINRIHNMRKKRIQQAKIGVIDVRGCYTAISGDPYALCQSMFGMLDVYNKEGKLNEEETEKLHATSGLLRAGECYSKYWIDRGVEDIICFRAPMTCHNNIRKMKVVNNPEIEKWYKYCKVNLILNSHDSVTHAENGADKDGDCFITTDNEVMLKTFKHLPTIFCDQQTCEKIIPTEEDLAVSNENGFGDEIGTVTNNITAMFDILALFDKDTKEYKEVYNRIMSGMFLQQNAIDKIKGIEFNGMPKEWCEYSACKIKVDKDTGEILDDEETIKRKEFNLRVLSNKKPYFFIYNYPSLYKEYTTYMREISKKCIIKFGLSIEEVKEEINSNKDIEKLEEKKKFIKSYNNNNPITNNNCIMNRLCRIIEDEFEKIEKPNKEEFDWDILKDKEVEYTANQKNKIIKLYEEYNKAIQDYQISSDYMRYTKEERRDSMIKLKEELKAKCLEVVSNEEKLCNIVIDICYTRASTKQFAWDMCGEQIIINLLKNSDNKINYITKDENGEIVINGVKYSMKTKVLKGENNNEDNA